VHTRDANCIYCKRLEPELTGIDDELAKVLIMKAREHWFTGQE